MVSEQAGSSGRSGNSIVVRFAVCVVVLAIVVLAFRGTPNGPPNELLRKIDQAQVANDLAEVERLTNILLEQAPDSDEACIAGARMALRHGKLGMASSFYDKLADYDGEWRDEVLAQRTQVFLAEGRLSDAEKSLSEILKRDADDVAARTRLFSVLRISGRTWEMQQQLLELLKRKKVDAEQLVACAATYKNWLYKTDNRTLKASYDRKDPLGHLSAVCEVMSNSEGAAGLDLLRGVVERRPDYLEAQGRLGMVLLDNQAFAEFRDWHFALPKEADGFPLIWHVRGLWAQKQKEWKAAGYCFIRALRLDANLTAANYQLSKVLVALERNDEAVAFAERSNTLGMMGYAAPETKNDPLKFPFVVSSLTELGRHWEAYAWCQIALKDRTEPTITKWAQEELRKLEQAIDRTSPLVSAADNPAVAIELKSFEAPNWNELLPESTTSNPLSTAASERAVSFNDSATAAGLDFSFFNGGNLLPDHAYMFEFSGGGVGIIDFDGDDWPDIYLTQGCKWPLNPQNHSRSDRLFRNLGNGKFADVTEAAGIKNFGYGQGVAVGDFNNDGLPDLYVANIGQNVLFQNNGDGTFDDVTKTSGIVGAVWTSSCLIADLNGDSWPDLYDVNYLGGENIFTRVCGPSGFRVQCFPSDYPGEQDRVYINQQDGTFRDVTESSGIQLPGGKGMGVIAADFDGSKRLSLFVTNDTTPNFYFANKTAVSGEQPALKFEEQGLLTGLALSESGKPSSCMGAAVGDVNLDGELDLFVTNFQLEPNNLFVRQTPAYFSDAVHQFRLRDPGFIFEGWGTQFLDGELDGYPDLLVANGHLDDYDHRQATYTVMKPQYFANEKAQYFVEVPDKKLGTYFETEKLGRAIALVDWNRDGLEDACVTHVDRPVSLLTNTTKRHGQFISLQLKGVVGSRDALGTTVHVTVGDRSWTRQLVAGDGFCASNERQLVFGLGVAAEVDELKIEWTHSAAQTFENVAVDQRYVVIEGRDELVNSSSDQRPNH